MKSTIETKPTPTMAEVVRAAVMGSPSFLALKAAKEKGESLSREKDATEAGLREMRAKRDDPKAESALIDKARALISGREPQANDAESIARAADRVRTLDAALTILSQEIATLLPKSAAEATQALQPQRQALVNRAAKALAELQEVAIQDAALRDEMCRSGLDVRFVRSVAFIPVPAVSGYGAHEDWLRTRENEGFVVS